MPVGQLIDITLTQPKLMALSAAAQAELGMRIAALGVDVQSSNTVSSHKSPLEISIEHTAELLDDSTYMKLFKPEALEAKHIRVRGLADAMTTDWHAAFRRLTHLCGGTVELCPTNECGCATGILTEWLLGGYGRGCSALFGTGELAATEQVAAALVIALEGRNFDLTILPALRSAWEDLKMNPIPAHAPIAGHDIYYVESGVHVDGVLKDPTNYEPLPPEALGSKRIIILGKHSGRSSIIYALAQIGITNVNDNFVCHMLTRVHHEATPHHGFITPAQFKKLVHQEMIS